MSEAKYASWALLAAAGLLSFWREAAPVALTLMICASIFRAAYLVLATTRIKGE